MAFDFDIFKKRLKQAREAEQDQRQNEIDDLEFEAGQHWNVQEERARKAAGKPCMTINLLSGPIKQVENQQRSARPGAVVTAVGKGADKRKASRWQALGRRVERLSQATRIYCWAGQYQVRMGRGFWGVQTIYLGDTDEKDIRLREFDNQHTIYVDPSAKKLNGEDKKWAVVFEDLTHEDYIAEFGESKLASNLGDGMSGVGDAPPEWITSSHCRIAEYFAIETESRTKLFLRHKETGEDSTAYEDELPRGERTRKGGKFAKGEVQLPEGVMERSRRAMKTHKVMWYLVNGQGEVLEQTRIPGQYIPIVEIFGQRRNINGKVDKRGMVRDAKDVSRMEDWCESSLMEAIADSKTSPWLAEFTQLEGLEGTWSGPTPKVLTYRKSSGENGQPLPPPIRVPSGVDVSALTMAAQRMQNHVKSVTGASDVFQEETASNQSRLSGVAMQHRRMDQELTNSDYMANLGDGVVLTYKIIMSMGREVWDTPRVMRITDDLDKEVGLVTYMGPDQERDAQQLLNAKEEIDEMFDLSGDPEAYDIAVLPGKRHDTARQETVDTLAPLIPNLPPDMQVKAIPILIENMDGEGMQELAQALKGEEKQGIPPQVQRHIEELTQKFQEALKIIETDQVKQQAQLQIAAENNKTKRDIEEMQLLAKVRMEQIDKDFELKKLQFEAQIAEMERAATFAHEARQGAAQRSADWDVMEKAHEQAQQQLEAQAALGMVQSGQDHEESLEQGEQGHVQALEQGQQAAELAPKPEASA